MTPFLWLVSSFGVSNVNILTSDQRFKENYCIIFGIWQTTLIFDMLTNTSR